MEKENNLMEWLKSVFQRNGAEGAARAEARVPTPHVAHVVYGGGFPFAPRVAHAAYSMPAAAMRARYDSASGGACGNGASDVDAAARVSNGAGCDVDAAAGDDAAAGACSDGVDADVSACGNAGTRGGNAVDDSADVNGDNAAASSLAQSVRASSSYAASFRRIEKKYRLEQGQYQKLLAVIQQHMQPDDYPQTVVSSLYYDTPANELISRSLEKPLYKEKLRVRSYGTLQEDGSVIPASDQIFLELKKKYKGVVYKRRLALSLDDAQAFLRKGNLADRIGVEFADAVRNADGAPLSYRERQVAREITAFLGRYDSLRPAMITQCVRMAWKLPGSQLRITFDEQLCAGRPAGDELALQMAGKPFSLLRPGQVLMEIKQAGGMPLWLVEALSAIRVYPQSFSKYGTAYQMSCGAGAAHEVTRKATYEADYEATRSAACKATHEATHKAACKTLYGISYETSYERKALHA